MDKNMMKPTIVLTILCLVAAAALEGTYQFTKPMIDAINERMAAEARMTVLPTADGFEPVDTELQDGVIEVYKATNGAGVVAVARQNHRESLRAVVNASPHPATLTPTGEILFSHEAVRGAENLVLPPYGFFMESLQEERNIQ